MCNGVSISAGPPVALPFGQSVTQATPKVQPPPGAPKTPDPTKPPSGSTDPNRGQTLDISA